MSFSLDSSRKTSKKVMAKWFTKIPLWSLTNQSCSPSLKKGWSPQTPEPCNKYTCSTSSTSWGEKEEKTSDQWKRIPLPLWQVTSSVYSKFWWLLAIFSERYPMCDTCVNSYWSRDYQNHVRTEFWHTCIEIIWFFQIQNPLSEKKNKHGNQLTCNHDKYSCLL